MTKKVSLLPTPKDEVPADLVVSWSDSSLFNLRNFPRYNPDELVGRKGLRIYDQMMVDEQVKAVVKFKRDAITAREYQFVYQDDVDLGDDEKARRIRFFNHALKTMSGSFNDALNFIARGMYHGFSLTEKIYTPIEFEGQAWIGLSALLPRPPDTFYFYVDEYGVLEKLEQQASGRKQTLDIEKFVHYVHNPESDQWYGRSELREAYRSWFAKDVLIKYWLVYLERLGGGFTIAKQTGESNLRPGMPEYEALKSVITNIRSATGMILPKGVEVEVVTPNSTDQYEVAIEYHDLAIAKALLVPNLLGISHTGQTGAYSQSQTQLEAFFWTLNSDSARLAGCLNEQLFRDLGDVNFGDGKYPTFTFKPASEEHIKWVITTWKDLLGAKAVTPTPEDEEHLRKLLDMPSVDVEQAQKDADQRAIDHQKAITEATAPAQQQQPKFSKVVPHGELKVATVEQFTRAIQRVAFTVIDRQTDRVTENHVESIADLVARGVDRMMDRQRVAECMQDPSLIQSVRIDATDVSKIKRAFIASLNDGWSIGARHSANEINNARKQDFSLNFARIQDMAAEWIESNGFRLAGNLTDGMRAIIQQELQNAVKYSWGIEETRATIYRRLIERGMTSMQAVMKYTADDADVGEVINLLKAALADEMEEVGAKTVNSYLRTLVRTNIFEAMNEARYAYFTDPKVADFVVAFEYSAILDDRTSELCRDLDGKIYAKDSPVWDELRPPNHFNCRSVLIPITAIDGWKGDEDRKPRVRAQDGFGSVVKGK